MAYPLFHALGPTSPLVLTMHEAVRAFPGEDNHLEFKQGVPEPKISEAVAAFSNSDGGVILLGVADSGQFVGLEVTGETTAKAHRAVRTVRDAGRYEVQEVHVDEKSILVISVQRRQEGFAQLPDGRVLVRRGAMNSPLLGQDLARFVSEHALTRFEAVPTEVDVDHAASDLVETVRATCGWALSSFERLAETGLAVRERSRPVLTVAGVLYLVPTPYEALGKTYIEIFRYREGSAWDRRTQIDGPVWRQVQETVDHVMAELGSDVVIVGIRRYELPRLPEAVLREAVANAVAHRSYEMKGQPIRIEIRPDRVTIRSPGGLPEPVTLENLREQSSARNLDVIKLLRTFRLAEDAGLGIDVMQDGMDDALLEPPRFASDDTYVEVTLLLSSTVRPAERAWITEVEHRGQIRGVDRRILLHAARGEILTNTAVRKLFDLDSTHARAALVRLRDLGYLTQHGERGGATYSLARELGPPPGLELDREQLRDVVISLAGELPTISNMDVRRRTGLDRVRALALLTSLVESGDLDRHGERRGSYYTRVG